MKDSTSKKKQYLKRYRIYMQRIDKLKEKMQELDVQMQGLSSQQITDMPRGGQGATLDDLLTKKEVLQHRLLNLNEIAIQTKYEIIDCIDLVDDNRYVEVLEAYFVEGLSFEDIAEDKSYSVRHIGYLYSKGLEVLKIDVD
ncbi:hypothetical protein [Vagococcus xieshaowenii]|uniref:DUF1492 domain-containing protein n=1 Tax=Vagococcus xieshaowenii TaxID=2562451 RepID=A0A4Z0D7K7_9ENTE|nr:hypothetical protein [Vagococcus xieshaowenii]QCA29160.1 hypothetical protein E4Z98_07470 [Vagococcus xieshaowenii]TFZ40862.1 hypothetical protein E4031_05620 [Vagococcus xieshaowenii]